ncbi:hypothetical protein ACJMK2_018316 [Sinanodonta woodiana]|uniref:Uncharacterized protein n=1 Tax=Sinanodonta woodiana TaxID=1069815 RepID=A0ABD3UFS2_SINWO
MDIVSRLIIFWFLLGTSLCYDTTFCSGKVDGYYADPVDCYSFYHCVVGVTYHNICSTGTIWDQSVLNCNYNGFGNCSATPTVFSLFRRHDGMKYAGTVLSSMSYNVLLRCAMACNVNPLCQSANYFTSKICETLSDVAINVTMLTESTDAIYLEKHV